MPAANPAVIETRGYVVLKRLQNERFAFISPNWAMRSLILSVVAQEDCFSVSHGKQRFRSRRDHTFAEKILSAMRKGFGAHVEPKNRKAKPS